MERRSHKISQGSRSRSMTGELKERAVGRKSIHGGVMCPRERSHPIRFRVRRRPLPSNAEAQPYRSES